MCLRRRSVRWLGWWSTEYRIEGPVCAGQGVGVPGDRISRLCTLGGVSIISRMENRDITYIDDSVLQNDNTNPVHENCAFDGALPLGICAIFKLPALSPLIELQAWVVISFIKILENG